METDASVLATLTGRRRRLRALLVAAGLVFALVTTEIGLRFVAFNDRFIVPDDVRGWGLRAGFTGWASEENVVRVRINSAGFRDRERAITAAPGTVRVAVLGDSYMEALNLPLEKAFPSYLETDLTGCPAATGRKVEVLNFGVSGYGTAQELLTYRHHASTYKPDIVALAVFTQNDIYDNSHVLSRDPSPKFVFHGDALQLDESFRSRLPPPPARPWRRALREFAKEQSRVVWLLDETLATLRFGGQTGSPPDDPGTDPRAFLHTNAFLEAAIYQAPTEPEMADAWRVTEALLLQISEEVRANGSEFWIVTLANATQVDPDLQKRMALQDKYGVDSLFYPDRRIRDFAEAHAIPVVMLAETLADYTAANRVYLNGGYRLPYGEAHWNEVGHRLAASLVSKRLCADSPALAARPRQ